MRCTSSTFRLYYITLTTRCAALPPLSGCTILHCQHGALHFLHFQAVLYYTDNTVRCTSSTFMLYYITLTTRCAALPPLSCCTILHCQHGALHFLHFHAVLYYTANTVCCTTLHFHAVLYYTDNTVRCTTLHFHAVLYYTANTVRCTSSTFMLYYITLPTRCAALPPLSCCTILHCQHGALHFLHFHAVLYYTANTVRCTSSTFMLYYITLPTRCAALPPLSCCTILHCQHGALHFLHFHAVLYYTANTVRCTSSTFMLYYITLPTRCAALPPLSGCTILH